MQVIKDSLYHITDIYEDISYRFTRLLSNRYYRM